MTFPGAATARSFFLFGQPYERLKPCGPEIIAELTDVDQWKGSALVWHLSGNWHHTAEYNALRYKAHGLPLLVLLPSATEIHLVAEVLPLVRLLGPRMILPYGMIDSVYRLRQVLALPPRSLPIVVTDYLVRRGLLSQRRVAREFRRLMELAPETRSIASLSRRLYTSRRTLGRHLSATGMPAPSHCLHFARLLHLSVHLQANDEAMFRAAARLGYPDGFTVSNQMKRLIGYRPSEVRDLLGWEWIVEAWLKKEGVV